MKKIIFFLFVFVAASMSGLVSVLFIAPKLAGIAPFSKMAFFNEGRDQTVIVNKTEQVVVERNTAFKKAYEKNIPALVAVKLINSSGITQSIGAGFIVSADGLILTRREWVGTGQKTTMMVVRGSEETKAEIVRVSEESGLALLKVNASGLPVVSFAKDVAGQLGVEAFLIGTKRGSAGQISFVNTGTVKSVDGKMVETNIYEDFRIATGTPLVNIEGDVIGINSVNSSGYVFAIASDEISRFLSM
ncbi:trypsin-like peptidase domain-containing protein [Candidatus Azambacteria bacterium]|nr:trypsin-like peptidase domain-containing protein [Candidatus Azambacteria bacterium]